MVETLSEALDQDWTLQLFCGRGKREAMKSIRECLASIDADLASIVWTRGREFPMALIGSRLKCPRCGSRVVRVLFQPPRTPVRAAPVAEEPWGRSAGRKAVGS